MKKLIIITAALAITGISSFAQGNVSIAGGVGGIWNNYTNVPMVTAGGFDVALLVGTGTPLISGISSTGSGTNATLVFSTATAWNDIMTDSAYSFVDGTNGLAMVANASTILKGTFAYNAGSSWSAANVNAGTTYNIYEIAWSTAGGLYTTASLAAQNDAYVGWSQVFSYTPTSGANQPTQISPANNVGWYGIGGVVPEPTTMALAGLGGLAMLLIRRRK